MSDEATWVVFYHRDLEKEIRRLPQPHVKQTLEAIEALAVDPRPGGSGKIKEHDLWRVRVGVYRILYRIDEENHVVSTYHIGYRKSVYRNL